MLKLQILIAAYRDGIQRVADAPHPQVDGVEYLICWQDPEGKHGQIPEALIRNDMRIVTSTSKGLSRCRNAALSVATAPLVWIADDDLHFSADGIRRVLRAFDEHPQCGLITFRYSSDTHPPVYPGGDTPFNLHKAPKGYYATSFECVARLHMLRQSNIRFNDFFGINSLFPAGEDDLFMAACLKSGMEAMHIPEVVVHHPGSTTCHRMGVQPQYIETRGAVMQYVHPITWPLRMIVHTLSAKRRGEFSPLQFCRAWISGIRKARKFHVFNRVKIL